MNDELTAREIEIVQQIANGLTEQQIAEELFISEKTVKNHKSNIYGKIKYRNQAYAVAYCFRKGLIT